MRRREDVDKELKRERYRGPLQGIPFGAKDLLSYAGQPTTWGAKPYAGAGVRLHRHRHRQAREDRRRAHRQARHGGTGGRRRLPLRGGIAVRPGPQSVGSHALVGRIVERLGSAVAAGLVPFAIGSETSGSIVTPAAFCGVTGLRPTYGLVSRHGAMALSWTLDKIGPMCRSAEDCGLVLQVIAGSDSNDPGSAGKSFYYTPQYSARRKICGSATRPSISPSGPMLPRAPPSSRRSR